MRRVLLGCALAISIGASSVSAGASDWYDGAVCDSLKCALSPTCPKSRYSPAQWHEYTNGTIIDKGGDRVDVDLINNGARWLFVLFRNTESCQRFIEDAEHKREQQENELSKYR